MLLCIRVTRRSHFRNSTSGLHATDHLHPARWGDLMDIRLDSDYENFCTKSHAWSLRKAKFEKMNIFKLLYVFSMSRSILEKIIVSNLVL